MSLTLPAGPSEASQSQGHWHRESWIQDSNPGPKLPAQHFQLLLVVLAHGHLGPRVGKGLSLQHHPCFWVLDTGQCWWKGSFVGWGVGYVARTVSFSAGTFHSLGLPDESDRPTARTLALSLSHSSLPSRGRAQPSDLRCCLQS